MIVQSNLRQLLAGEAIAFHMAHRELRGPVGGGEGTEGRDPLGIARHILAPFHRRELLRAGKRGGFINGAEAEDVAGEACLHRIGGFDDGPQLRGRFRRTDMPTGFQPQHFDQVVRTDGREAEETRHLAGIGGDAIDLIERQPGVGDGFAHGIDREQQRRAGQAHPDLRHADAADIGFALRHGQATFSNRGNQMPSCSSNTTCTRSSISTASTGLPTILVVRYTPGASSSFTRAMTKGTSISLAQA